MPKASLPAPTSDGFVGCSEPLSVAVLHDNRTEMLALLPDLGFDPKERMRVHGKDQIMYSGGGPLYSRVKQGNRQMAELRPARGADPNACVYTFGSPLFRAHSRRDWDFVKLLEQQGFLDAVSAG